MVLYGDFGLRRSSILRWFWFAAKTGIPALNMAFSAHIRKIQRRCYMRVTKTINVLFFEFSISGIKCVSPVGIAVGSGKSLPLRALCFPLSCYRLNRLPSYLQEARTHAISRAHHAPETSVAFLTIGSTSAVALLS